MHEYLLRVKPLAEGGFVASIREFAQSSHPEVRAVIGPASMGRGQTAPGAMLSAIINARLADSPVEPRQSRYAC